MTQRYIRCAFSCLFFTANYLLISAQCPITVDAGEDVYLCAPPTPTQLQGSIDGDFLNFFWTPTTGMIGSNSLTPTVTVSGTTSYVLTGRAADLSNNLIDNGDFESGNSGFSSDYIYMPGNLLPEGVYDVIDNPQLDHPGFAPCDDHTSGNGNMMVVNGSGTPGLNVWCETISISPNSLYVFSAWVTTVVMQAPALLQFSINGVTIGPIFNAPGQNCTWANFFATWNSGSATSATICIVNQNTSQSGNDFALDDLVFSPVCLLTDTVTVHVINVAAVAAPALQTIPCNGANLTLNGTGSSTGPNVTYYWDTPNGNIVSGENTLMPLINAAGTYTLTVSYQAPNGTVCEKSATITVIESSNPLIAWINPPQPIGCGSATTTLVGNSSQSAFSAYEWSTLDGNIVSGQFAKNCVVNQAGIYTLLVTNTTTGCTATAEVTVTTATNPPIANATTSGLITCIQNTAPLSGAGSTTGLGIVYAWTTPNGTINSGQNMQNAVAGAAGMYILAVTNNTNGCISRDTILVTSNTTPPTLSTQPPGLLDCDTDTLTLSTTVNPGAATLVWSATPGGMIVGGQGTPNPQVTTDATYSVLATNPVNGCTATTSIIVSADHTPPVAMALPADSITCQSPSVTLSGAGSSIGPNFIYAWTAGPGGNIVSGADSLSPLVNASATYTLLVTNLNNACTALAFVPVVSDTNVVVAIANAPDTLSCVVNSATLDANGSTSGPAMVYAWTTMNGTISSGADTPTPTATAPGTYQLLLTNTANGCSATDLAILAQDIAPPNVQIDLPDTLTCASPAQNIIAHNLSLPGSFSYDWLASNGGNITAGADSLAPTVNSPGVYTLITNNLNNGCSSTLATSVQQEAGVPTAIINPPQVLNCTVLQQTLNTAGSSAGGNFSFNWTASNGGNITGGSATPAPTVNAPGTYSLTITNTANGCTATGSMAVVRDTATPQVQILPPVILTCLLPEQNLQAQNLSLPGSFSYQWSFTGSGNIVSGGTTLTPLVSSSGLYSILVTNTVNTCTATQLVAVSSDVATPGLLLQTPGTLTCTSPMQVLPVQNQSLPGNFNYSWTATNGGNFVSGNTTLNPTVDAAGDYMLIATNSGNGCTSTLSTAVGIDTAAPLVLVQMPGIVTCAAPMQTIQAQNVSGPGSFTYAWTATNGGNISAGQNNLSPVVDAGGTYNLLTTNTLSGCTATATAMATENTTPPVADAGLNDTLSCALSSLIINGVGTGNGPLTYAWTASNGGNFVSGINTATPSVDAAGAYTLTVINTANGCSATDAVQVFNDLSAPTANAGTAATLTCTVLQTALNATASTGPSYSYVWTASNGGNIVSGPGSLTPVVDAPGNYQLVVTNSANGCTSLSALTVMEDIAPPAVDAGLTAILTCTAQSVGLSGTATAVNGGNLFFVWSGTGIQAGGNTPTPTVIQAGTFTLNVLNALNGCTASDVVSVGIDTLTPTLSAAAPQILTCAVLSVPLSGNVVQPANNFSVSWATMNGQLVSGQTTLSPLIDEPGLYTLTVVNQQNGCTATATATATENVTPPIAVATAPGPLTCTNPQLNLSGMGSSPGPGFSYLWTAIGGGNITGGPTTLTPSINAQGGYTLMVTNAANGCTASATTLVSTFTTPPTLNIIQPQPLTCVTTSVVLPGAVSQPANGFTFSWSTSNGHFVSGQTSLSPLIDEPGLYTLTVQNQANGCTATATATATENITPPVAEAGPTSELHCNQPDIVLQGSSTTPSSLSFVWSTTNGQIVSGSTTPQPTVDAAGAYSLTVTNLSNGCTAVDQVAITQVMPPDFTPSAVQPNCLQPKGRIDFGPVANGEAPFMYSINSGQTFMSSPAFNSLASGDYLLVVEDAYGCTADAAVSLQTPLIPTVTLPEIVTIDLGENIQLTPLLNIPIAQVASWQWTPPDSLSCTDCPGPIANPIRSIKYVLKIKDLNGCPATASVQVRVNRRRNIYAPNIFSPNGDGENDRFTLYGKGVRDVRTLRIYDRWGAELFLAEHLPLNSEPAGWDGGYRGVALNPAVFVWIAVVEFVDGEVEVLKGDVTLMR